MRGGDTSCFASVFLLLAKYITARTSPSPCPCPCPCPCLADHYRLHSSLQRSTNRYRSLTVRFRCRALTPCSFEEPDQCARASRGSGDRSLGGRAKSRCRRLASGDRRADQRAGRSHHAWNTCENGWRWRPLAEGKRGWREQQQQARQKQCRGGERWKGLEEEEALRECCGHASCPSGEAASLMSCCAAPAVFHAFLRLCGSTRGLGRE